ncbi:MAG: hypothetical protein NZO58_02780 [Gemmataceae bacterium]|nr:hypothetical protein [Gemmataceae bacterium]
MNRISCYLANKPSAATTLFDRQNRFQRRLRAEADFFLREVAYVLALTERVKAQILRGDRESAQITTDVLPHRAGAAAK